MRSHTFNVQTAKSLNSRAGFVSLTARGESNSSFKICAEKNVHICGG